MLSCPRCFGIVDGGSAYCGICGRPRIVESLRTPIAERAWMRLVRRSVVALFSIWLLLTIGVAFLREAKAVRVARKMLMENRAQDAWSHLSPFIKAHPQHSQALFLCGKATIRLGQRAEAKQCREDLGALSPELGKALNEDYLQVLTEQSQSLGCSATSFEQLLAWEEDLGDSIGAGVTAGLDQIIEACGVAGNSDEPAQLAAIMEQREQAMAMIEKGYIPAITRAVAQGRYGDAENFAEQAVTFVPQGTTAVDAVLEGERSKTAVTVQRLQQLCSALGNDPQYRNGWSLCFPAAAPPMVQSARDGWGNAIHYTPITYAGDEQCNTGFTLTSYGSDGKETQDDRQSPAAETSCRFTGWGEYWQTPSAFWLRTDGG